MQPFENMKVLNAIPPGVIKDDAAYVSNVIDIGVAGGAKSLVFGINLGTIDADLAALRVMESDTQSSATALGGSPAVVVDVLDTVTPGDANDGAVLLVEIDLAAPRKRYLQLQATAGDGAAGTYLAATAYLVNVGVPPTYSGALNYIKG